MDRTARCALGLLPPSGTRFLASSLRRTEVRLQARLVASPDLHDLSAAFREDGFQPTFTLPTDRHRGRENTGCCSYHDRMQRFLIVLAAALLAAPFVSLLVGGEWEPVPERIHSPAGLLDTTIAPLPPEYATAGERSFRSPGEDSIFRRAAELAWHYVDRQYNPSTGLTNSVIGYPYATIWDMGSSLAAHYAAYELGLLAEEEYHIRTDRVLRTLGELPLFGGAAFNKNYQVRRGVPAGRSDRETREGYGWSATDMGRLLVWLRIIATAHPRHADAAEAVVARVDLDRLVRDGYLWGEDLDPNGRHQVYQEGRVGYEQYAAAGFLLWGAHADSALSLRQNASTLEIFGVPVLVDQRGGGHLTSEPYLMLGMELGWWSPHWGEQARQLLAAQEARFRDTGQVTIVTEDAIPVAPHYFYYYTLHFEGSDFAVVALTSEEPLPGPRWISTKGAFAWYALEPNAYTWRALQAVQPAADPQAGWASGIYEESGRPTGGQNINTSAIILEAALYRQLGRPILEGL